MATTVTPRMAVYRHLRDTAEVSALVEDRVYYQVRDDGAAYPCIVINTISEVPIRDLAGVAWTQTRLQVTVMGTTQGSAEQVARAVQDSLDGFSGFMAGALEVMQCWIDSVEPMHQEETGQTHVHVDVIITHK